MPIQAKYVHTNIVAEDWRALVRFYQDVFGCIPLPPERDYQGPWITDVTTIADVSIQGMHVQLPGSRQPDRPPAATNLPGFAHIAFHVDDVPKARQAVLDGGGHDLGKIHQMDVPGAGTITLVYMTDPEGNIVELQNWS